MLELPSSLSIDYSSIRGPLDWSDYLNYNTIYADINCDDWISGYSMILVGMFLCFMVKLNPLYDCASTEMPLTVAGK